MIRQLRYFWDYARKHLPGILLAVLLLAGDVAVTTVMPWMMSEIVDNGVLAGRMDVIRRLCILMTVLALLGSAIGFLCSVLTSVLAQRISNTMRKDIFRKILSLSYGQTDHLSPGTLLTRIISDTQIVTQFGAAVLQMLLKPAALFVMGLVMSLVISGKYALVFGIAIPVQVVLLILFMKRLNPLFVKIQLQIEKINSRIQETLSHLRLIKAYRRTKDEHSAFQDTNTGLLDLNLRIQYTLAVMNPVIMLIINLVLIAIIAVGGGLVRGGEAEAGRVIAAIMYIQQIMMSLMTIGQIYQIAGRAAVSCGRLEEIRRMEPAVPEGAVPLEEPIREIVGRAVCYSYAESSDDTPPAVRAADFRIPAGSFTAIVGPTGSGKSTLASLIARLRVPTSGEILLNGRPLTDWTETSVRVRMAIVLQENTMLSGTIADNIRYGLTKASMDDVREAARIAQADDFVSRLPEGYDTPVAESGASLSGGQKQCIAIARALLRKPEMLILDDSASSLDLLTEARLRAALREAFPRMTLLVITQRVISVTEADRIWLMEDGAISISGTHAELLRDHPLYREMFEALQPEEDA